MDQDFHVCKTNHQEDWSWPGWKREKDTIAYGSISKCSRVVFMSEKNAFQ
jgi:hypothetical protein